MSYSGSFFGDYRLGDAPDQAGQVFMYHPGRSMPLTFVRPNGQVIELTEAFETDGATIPWPAQCVPWLKPFGFWRKAAFVHDWLWELRYRGKPPYGFLASNRVLYEACMSLGLARWKAWVVWAAVCAFGWWFWYRGGP